MPMIDAFIPENALTPQAEQEPEGGQLEEVKGRVWVITAEIPDGSWGARGRVVRCPRFLQLSPANVVAKSPWIGSLSELDGKCKVQGTFARNSTLIVPI